MKLFSLLRNISDKQNDKSNFPAKYVIQGQLVTNISNIAESFNGYFSKMGLTTNQNRPSTSTKYTEYLPKPILYSIFIDPVTPSDMTYTVSKLKSKIIYGHDKTSTELSMQTTSSTDPLLLE